MKALILLNWDRVDVTSSPDLSVLPGSVAHPATDKWVIRLIRMRNKQHVFEVWSIALLLALLPVLNFFPPSFVNLINNVTYPLALFCSTPDDLKSNMYGDTLIYHHKINIVVLVVWLSTIQLIFLECDFVF